MKIWLSPEILDWGFEKLYNCPDRTYDFKKPHIFLKYAKDRFSEVDKYGEENEENLVLNDIVINLKQAIEHREEELHRKFKFSQLPFAKPKKYEILEQFDIVQPIFANNLRLLRNTVIHEQKAPLGKEKKDIKELWEFVWYFLRSTDVFLARYIAGMFFYHPDDNKFHSVDEIYGGLEDNEECIEIDNILYPMDEGIRTTLKIKGSKLPSSLFSLERIRNWIEIDVSSISMCDCKTPACKKFYETAGQEAGISYPICDDRKSFFYSLFFCEAEIIEEHTEGADKKISQAYRDMMNTQKQRIQEYLDSESPVSFGAKIYSNSPFYEKIIRRYLSLHIWY